MLTLLSWTSCSAFLEILAAGEYYPCSVSLQLAVYKILKYLSPSSKTLERHFPWEFNSQRQDVTGTSSFCSIHLGLYSKGQSK